MAKPIFLQNDSLRYIFFGGKGGVGKTTSAAAAALYLACRRPEERILVISTDPAHSLGDSLGQPIGDQVVPIRGVDNLFALELDSEGLLAEWKRECTPTIARIADRGTYFGEEDINNFLQLTLPGMDEAMAIMRIVALAEEQQYDRVMIDTAPTGHTLRLLALPAQMKLWIEVMDRFMEKHRFVVRSLVGRYKPDDVDRWLIEMGRQIRHVSSLLRDARVTEFVPVTIPEEMAICETERLVTVLKEHPMAVRNLVINQVVGCNGYDGISPSEGCLTCRQREKDQAGALAQIEEGFADLCLLTVPQLSHEVRGLKRLTEFGQLLTGDQAAERDRGLSFSLRGFALTVFARARAWLGLGRYWDWARMWLDSLWAPRRREDKETKRQRDRSLSPPLARFVLIGGKGGVGKTTTAAATALYLARRRPDQRVLVFSTDPAHSVGDSFDQPVGARVTPIEPYDNLYAYEIDAARLLEDFRREYRSGGARGQQARGFGDEVSSQMLDLVPPGLDELMALLEIMDLAKEGKFDVFILDTAPSGHLVRFLETPELAQDWLKAAARMLLKYKNAVRLGKLAELVIKYSRQVRTLRRQLVDSARTEFIAVTVPEAMAAVESGRLLRHLRGLNVTYRQMLINKVTQDSACRLCAVRRWQEQKIIRQLRAEHPDLRLAQTPQLPHPVRGIEGLTEFGEMLYSS